jgi:hypothetical protein
MWRYVNDFYVLNMMFIIMCCIFSFTWIVRNCMKLSWWLVDNCDNDYVDDDAVMTPYWIVTCWFCGCKYLIMQLLLKLFDVNGGYPLYWLLNIYEVILRCQVFAWMSMHHSHVELLMLWNVRCKMGVKSYIWCFYFGENVRWVWKCKMSMHLCLCSFTSAKM